MRKTGTERSSTLVSGLSSGLWASGCEASSEGDSDSIGNGLFGGGEVDLGFLDLTWYILLTVVVSLSAYRVSYHDYLFGAWLDWGFEIFAVGPPPFPPGLPPGRRSGGPTAFALPKCLDHHL